MPIHRSYAVMPPIPNAVSPTQWLTASETAELLLVKEKIVGLYIRDKGLKASRVGKRWLIDRNDLDAFIRSRQKAGR